MTEVLYPQRGGEWLVDPVSEDTMKVLILNNATDKRIMRKFIVSGISVVSAVSILALPMLANAQTAANPQQGIIGLLVFANAALNDVIVVLITLAIVVFFYGLIRYILSNAGGEAKAGYLNTILYSILAIFVMVSIWGVIHLLQATFGVGNAQAETPSLNTTLPVQ